MTRGLLALAVVVGAGIGVGVAYERRRASRHERLDVYFDDGSFVTYVQGSTNADQLLPLARHVLSAVRG